MKRKSQIEQEMTATIYLGIFLVEWLKDTFKLSRWWKVSPDKTSRWSADQSAVTQKMPLETNQNPNSSFFFREKSSCWSGRASSIRSLLTATWRTWLNNATRTRMKSNLKKSSIHAPHTCWRNSHSSAELVVKQNWQHLLRTETVPN